MSSAFTAWGVEVTVLELGAVVLALVGIALGIRGTRWAWPPYLGSSLLYAALFLRHALYASAALQLVFGLAAVWGFFGWGEEGVVRARTLRSTARAGVALAVVAGWLLSVPILRAIGGAATAPDAFLLVASLVAQVLMVTRFVESWLMWLVADVVGIVHYARQGLWFTSLLYLVLVVMAIVGLRAWAARGRTVPT
jgi:nicotinamide mononucleotide transporter